MRDIKASTRDEGRLVEASGGRAGGEAGGLTNQNNGAERHRASREVMASMLRDATIRTVMSTIAHDVNQPLAAVVTNANAGLRWLNRPEPDVDEVQTLLARIVKEGHRAGDLIAGIRAKFSELHTEARAVGPCEVVADVVSLLGDELQSHRIAVRNEMPEGLPPVLAERTRLALALFNVIVNAVEAMESVTDRDRVLTISSKRGDADQLLIAIEDSGTGIDSDSMDRLFEAFVTTKAHRAGMGLPISRKIIEAYGGRIWASARDPYGSAFFVALPVAAAADDQSGG
jgi:C4-dicarboxylate-specific signal transduction histidine kinase